MQNLFYIKIWGCFGREIYPKTEFTSHSRLSLIPLDCSGSIYEHASLSKRQKSESQDESWSAVTDSQQRTEFVGTVTVAWERLKEYKHMSCFIFVLLPLQWNEVKLDAIFSNIHVSSQFTVSSRFYRTSERFVHVQISLLDCPARESKRVWILFSGGRPVSALQRQLKRNVQQAWTFCCCSAAGLTLTSVLKAGSFPRSPLGLERTESTLTQKWADAPPPHVLTMPSTPW